MQITDGQINAFGKSLVLHGVLEKSQVAGNADLIAEALKLSTSRDGLAMEVYNTTELPVGEVQKTAATSAYNGQTLTKAIHDPIEIFSLLYTSKKNEEKAQQRKANELIIDKALTAWYYYEKNTPAGQRYNPSIGGYVTKDYFLDNLYPCPHAAVGCHLRFKTPEEAYKHRWQHGG